MRIKRVFLLFLALIMLITLSTVNFGTAFAVDEVYLGGQPAGFCIKTCGASIVGIGDVLTEDGLISPCGDSEIEIGDVLTHVDGIEINSVGDVERALKFDGDKLLTLKRKSQLFTCEITPAKDISGSNRLGLFLRDFVNGIGTITYISGNNVATLGHPVLDDDGALLEIKSGELCGCKISGAIKGVRGRPGALRGIITSDECFASIKNNTDCGVYGEIIQSTVDFTKLKKVKIGDAQIGAVKVVTTIFGDCPKEYDAVIVKADLKDDSNKNIVIKITDERLIEQTGGIVQGMSGSPILQDGKLVGAITHVFVNDSTRGFGVSINNMRNCQ